MTDIAGRAIDVDAANYQLGNETFTLARAMFVRNREVADIYDANHMTGIEARSPAEIDELMNAAEREFQHANHRRFDVDYRTPPEFAARLLLDGGYLRTDALVMLLEGGLIGEAPRWDIRPVATDADWEAYWELSLLDWRESRARTGRAASDAVGRQMWQANRRKQPPVQNWFACDGERPIGFFNSWEGVGGIGQVENLFVHPDYRKRGAATALIHHCVAQSRAKGAGPVVIVADPTDTPKNVYARMGFRPVAVAAHFTKRLNAEQSG
jgi:predicted N-acetyltransferase YhbS